ncbi:GIY-YIG nuclease family protein [Candidatus Spongiisocius sp.]|uniref:GIY-YIG nuclease family protein n=1 Tax=Candidatus Spongiisocius sp. TaxID=3101273 RepID=UPI003B5C8232
MPSDEPQDAAGSTERGFVYILTNEAMPGLVKIGMAEDPYQRAATLYTTGVPLPFEVAYAALVDHPNQWEAALHNAFSPQRVNSGREYFEIDPHQAVGILELVAIEDLPISDCQPPALVHREALSRVKKKLPPLNFDDLGVEPGTVLKFIQHPDAIASVATYKKVVLTGYPEGYPGPGIDSQPISLTPLTVGLRSFLRGRQLASHQPTPYWCLPDGRTVLEAHKQLHHRPPAPD